jgi:NADPH:quinone reductase-like Zn-dependent oxidoreductase
MEAAGTVLDTGANVSGLLPGDRVAYLGPAPGAYCEVRSVPADWVVRLPAPVEDDVAAALLLKGITADYLLHDLGHVGPARGCWCTRPRAASACSSAHGHGASAPLSWVPSRARRRRESRASTAANT